MKDNKHWWPATAASALFVLGMAMPGTAFADDADVLNARITNLNSQIGALSTKASELQTAFLGFGSSNEQEAPRIHVAQSSSELASVNVRVSQLEEQMRTLTGQIEGLQFQMTQLQTLLQRMQEDSDARFSALEGGATPGKTEAAPQSEGATPSGGGPQPMDLTSQQDASDFDLDLDNTGDAPVELGSPEHPLGTLSGTDLDNALDHSQDVGNLVSDADADAQYQAGYDAFVRGDYSFAEDQFRQFIALFPEHPRAPDATNWLGEALIQSGSYDEAAEILLTGYQSYPSSSRAPDMLFKLGIALAGAGEYETACRTFSEVTRRYPDLQQTFKDRVREESSKAGC